MRVQHGTAFHGERTQRPGRTVLFDRSRRPDPPAGTAARDADCVDRHELSRLTAGVLAAR